MKAPLSQCCVRAGASAGPSAYKRDDADTALDMGSKRHVLIAGAQTTRRLPRPSYRIGGRAQV